MKYLLAIFLATAAILPRSASGQERVVPQELINSYFGAQKIVLNYLILPPARPNDRVTWTVAVGDQVIARRDARPAATDNGDGQFAIELELPEARIGIVLPLTVVISVNGEKVHERTLSVFPEDAFAGKHQSLVSQQIVLFDPENITSAVFEGSKIPFAPERNIDSLEALTNSTLVVGEGVSFRDYRTLPQPEQLLLRRNDVIRQFDKRFDSLFWSPDGKVVASSVLVTGERNAVTGIVTTDERGWPWIDVRFSGSGRLVICGFAIIEKWDSGPTPRYLLAELLSRHHDMTHLTKDPSVDPTLKGQSR
jgi:hypothetical protein